MRNAFLRFIFEMAIMAMPIDAAVLQYCGNLHGKKDVYG